MEPKAFRDLTRMEPLEGHRMIRSRAARRSNGWKRVQRFV
ncbi:hypothetical protein HMPREF1545_04138 [Oscillibacter sp. KLE 1728]|nr:hypothetical protein HMPREF1545_04138 [Oscillibacter sp. KLE 1728]ERK58955.1 hypothetical protein HMPREF1546_03554 [Oscillibacter sp. KLE 1745]